MSSPSFRRVVLDTDAFNEVDDQFALAHLLLSPEQVRLEAVYAAPFLNRRSVSPSDGMERSYEEIGRVIAQTGTLKPPVFRGSTAYLPGASQPVPSEAAHDLIERALATKEEKLYVLGIAASTNIASALLLEPKIADKIVVVWLGGHAPYWPHTREFNLLQDLHAARVLLDSKVSLVLLPCYPVASHLSITGAELEQDLAPHSKLGRYLTGLVHEHEKGRPSGWSKVIWDIAASAWAINSKWITAEKSPSPVLKDDLTWGDSTGRHLIEIARQIDRDAIFHDFYAKARKLGAKPANP